MKYLLPFVLFLALLPSLANGKERTKSGVRTKSPAPSHVVVEEKYFPLTKGATWIYRDAENHFLRREVTGIQPVAARLGSHLEALRLTFIVVQADTGEQAAILKKKSKQAKTVKTEIQYYLKTSRGILNSGELGEAAELFWKRAFLVLPNDPGAETSWETWIHGTRIKFAVEKAQPYVSAAGKFSDCLRVNYQQGLEGTSDGYIIYCAGVGEVKLVEGTFERELVQYLPAKKGAANAAAPVLDTAATEKIWALLFRGELVVPPAETTQTASEPERVEKPRIIVLLLGALALLGVIVALLTFFLRKIRLDRIPRDTAELLREIERSKAEHAKGNIKQSQGRLEDLLKDFPDYPDLHYQLGIIQEESRNDAAAIAHYRKAININPHYIEAHLRLAQLYQNQKNFHQALENVTAVLDMHPEYADVHNIAGEIFRNLGDETKARTHFQQALELNPHYAEARRNLEV